MENIRLILRRSRPEISPEDGCSSRIDIEEISCPLSVRPLFFLRLRLRFRRSRAMTNLSKCCVSGHLHHGEPKGTIEKYAGLDTYITGTNTSQSIVIITVNLHFLQCIKSRKTTHLLFPGYLWHAFTGVLGTDFSQIQVDLLTPPFGQNVKLVADEYAQAGNFRVLVPDFFQGIS